MAVFHCVLDGDTGEELGAYRDPEDAWAAKRERDREGRRNAAQVVVEVLPDN